MKNKTIQRPHSPALYRKLLEYVHHVHGIGLSEVRNALCQPGRVISRDLKCPVQMLHTTALAECN